MRSLPIHTRRQFLSSGLGIVMLVAFLGLSWLLSTPLERAPQRS